MVRRVMRRKINNTRVTTKHTAATRTEAVAKSIRSREKKKTVSTAKITAASPEEFVRLLREGSRFDYDCTDQECMENFVRRYGELHGVSVATDTPEHFLTDLQAAGYVR